MLSSHFFSDAKELFFKYNGSHLQMEKAGEYQRYKEFRIPNEIEKKWAAELKRNSDEKL